MLPGRMRPERYDTGNGQRANGARMDEQRANRASWGSMKLMKWFAYGVFAIGTYLYLDGGNSWAGMWPSFVAMTTAFCAITAIRIIEYRRWKAGKEKSNPTT